MKQIYFILFIITWSSSIYGQGCMEASYLVKKIWDSCGKWEKNASLIEYNERCLQNQKEWNHIIAEVASPNNYRLLYKKHNDEGTIMGRSSRIYVSNPLYNDVTKVIVNQLGGEGLTSIFVCLHDDQGNSKRVEKYDFKQEIWNGRKEFVIKGSEGMILTLIISCKSALGSFTYDVLMENS